MLQDAGVRLPPVDAKRNRPAGRIKITYWSKQAQDSLARAAQSRSEPYLSRYVAQQVLDSQILSLNATALAHPPKKNQDGEERRPSRQGSAEQRAECGLRSS